MPLYPMNHYPTKKAFKEAVKKNGGVLVYDEGIVPIVNQHREATTARINGKLRRVIRDAVIGPNKHARKWDAAVYLDADEFERGFLWVIKVK